MSLDFINSVAPLLTVVIVAATAIAALVQLKHMRAGNQITAMLSIGEEFSGKLFADAANLLRAKLNAAMEDPVYREYEAAMSAGGLRRRWAPTTSSCAAQGSSWAMRSRSSGSSSSAVSSIEICSSTATAGSYTTIGSGWSRSRRWGELGWALPCRGRISST